MANNVRITVRKSGLMDHLCSDCVNTLDLEVPLDDTFSIYSPPDQPSGLGRGFVLLGSAGHSTLTDRRAHAG